MFSGNMNSQEIPAVVTSAAPVRLSQWRESTNHAGLEVPVSMNKH
jgi:hypothetical protein